MRWCALVTVAACSSPGTGSGPAKPLFDPSADDFYALPFPNDLRRNPDHSLDFSKFPSNSPIVDVFRDAAATLDGFGLNESIYVRFTTAIDPTSLPDPAGSIADGAAVYLVDVDPQSRHYEQKVPVILTFLASERGTMGPNSLCARPYPGFSLDGNTAYALIVTTRVNDASGAPIEAADGFVIQPNLSKYLIDHADDVAVATEFTTQHFDNIVAGIRAGIYDTDPPVAANVVAGTHTDPSFKEFVGSYVAPNFQQGDVPYSTAPSGQILFDTTGTAIPDRMETMRFALTVPVGTPPTGGWPIVVYAHGTGGDYESFIDDGTGARLAAQGLATISTDQVLHGPRNPGGDPETAFFNLQNPFAARDNPLQGAADAFSQLRLATGGSLTDGTNAIPIDASKAMFFGHSQGGLTGPGFVAYEPGLKGAVLSGTAGLIYLALLYKTNPIDIPSLVQTAIHDDPVDENNPTLAMLQMWLDRSDPINYASRMVRDPMFGPDGNPTLPRSIFQSEGFTDTYAPNPGIEAFATAIGGDLVMTADEQAVEGLSLRGRTVKAPPFSDNLDNVTAVLAQYKQAAGSDGHFVVFEVPSAEKQSADFLGTLAATGTATVVTPN